MQDLKQIYHKYQYALMGVVGIATAIITYKLYNKLQYDKHALQGPKPSDSTLGNFPDMAKAGSLHEYLEQLTRAYGRIGAFYWGKTRVAYITSQKILHDEENRKIFDKLHTKPAFLFEGFKPLLGDHSVGYTNNDEYHARYRSLWIPGYQHNMINKIPIFANLTQEIVDKWTKSIEENNDNGIAVDIVKEAFTFSSRSVIFASFGSNISDDVCSNILDGFNDAWEEMEKRIIDGIPPDAERDEKFKQSLDRMHNAVRQIIKEKDKEKENDLFIKLISNNVGKQIYNNEQKILDEAVTAVVGGTHTTGNGIAWLFYYVAKDESIQKKMFDEIKHHFKENKDIKDMDTKRIFDRIKKLVYCKQVIDETLRISSLAPWAARINYKEDMMINKCDGSNDKILIPKGMAMIIGQGVALNDENVFNDPFKFNPDRWSRRNVKKSKMLQRSGDAIFGGLGGRLCPGWAFFRTEALVFLVAMISRFQMKLHDDSTVGVTTKFGLVSTPKEQLKIVITKR